MFDSEAIRTDPDLATFQAEKKFRAASDFLRAMSHEGRLIILCHLVDKSKSVQEITALLSCRQSSASQQLKILKSAGLVSSKRKGKRVFYSLADPKVAQTVERLSIMFCDANANQKL